MNVIPKTTNENPTTNSCYSFTSWHFLHLTGPKFNVPGKVDMFLGADVLEEVK